MKILDAGTTQLANAEVLDHIQERHATWAKREEEAKRRNGSIGTRPRNLDKVLTDAEFYLKLEPSPLANSPRFNTFEAVPRLCARLKGLGLTKPEVLQIINFRPSASWFLTIIIEDFEARYPTEEQQQEILHAVHEELGGNAPILG
ncbi:MAG: hypothetical protein M1820_003566 [Bogoriella megaspora]|nr:MAG: hypothetical protein M1820_003566 [Bogoriella megaspora]